MDGNPFAQGSRLLQKTLSGSIILASFRFMRLVAAMTVSSLVVVWIALPATRADIRESLGIRKTIVLDEDVVINGDLPDEEQDDADAYDCETAEPLTCEFVTPDVTVLIMPPAFIGPWAAQRLEAEQVLFVFLPGRWELVCRP
jgi:hypothetical protein